MSAYVLCEVHSHLSDLAPGDLCVSRVHSPSSAERHGAWLFVSRAEGFSGKGSMAPRSYLLDSADPYLQGEALWRLAHTAVATSVSMQYFAISTARILTLPSGSH
jgi:hypothetical protein